MKSYEEARLRLAELAEDGYREFSVKTTMTERPFLGVRIPLVRELAGAVAHRGVFKVIVVSNEKVNIGEIR